jgi:hypothetical protein
MSMKAMRTLLATGLVALAVWTGGNAALAAHPNISAGTAWTDELEPTPDEPGGISWE